MRHPTHCLHYFLWLPFYSCRGYKTLGSLSSTVQKLVWSLDLLIPETYSSDWSEPSQCLVTIAIHCIYMIAGSAGPGLPAPDISNTHTFLLFDHSYVVSACTVVRKKESGKIWNLCRKKRAATLDWKHNFQSRQLDHNITKARGFLLTPTGPETTMETKQCNDSFYVSGKNWVHLGTGLKFAVWPQFFWKYIRWLVLCGPKL